MKNREFTLGKLACLASILALALPAVVGATHYTCLPSCADDDGRFLVVTDPTGSITLETLTDNVLEVTLKTEECNPGVSEFTVGIFDGDVGRVDATGDPHWDIAEGKGVSTWQVWTDKGNDGCVDDGMGGCVDDVLLLEIVDDPDNPPLIMPDNDWIDGTFIADPAAVSDEGECIYRLFFQLDQCCGTVNNAFKIRVAGEARIEVYQQPFSYIASLQGYGTSMPDPGALPDTKIVYPPCAGAASNEECLDTICMGADIPTCLEALADEANTTYDGSFSFFFELTREQEKVIYWDGDWDRGKWDCSDLDQDDLNSPVTPDLSLSCGGLEDPPDCFFPPSFAGPPMIPQPEGIALGLPGLPSGGLPFEPCPLGRPPLFWTTGAPQDDNIPFSLADPTVPGLNSLVVRQPSIRSELYYLDPSQGPVLLATNEDPSGNQEWEKFRVDWTGTSSPDPDGVVDATWPDTFPAGIYELRVKGLDLQNLNALYMPYAIVGEPCDECEGGIVQLTMRYLGTENARVRAGKDDADIYYDSVVDLMPGQEFTFTGSASDLKMASDTRFWVGDNLDLDTIIHTSCSKPIYPGLTSGSFRIVSAVSKDAGLICDETFNRPCETSGKETLDIKDEEVKWKVRNTGEGDIIVESLTLSWPAANGNLVEVILKDKTIWTGDEPPPATQTTLSSLLGHKDRVIKKDEEKELKLIFANDASTTGSYGILVDFLEGCSVQFGGFPGTLGDFVWEDQNADGIQDPGEPGVSGVTVELLDTGADGSCNSGDETVLAATTTDGNGLYQFIVDTPADYCVRVVLPAGYEFTVPNQGGDNELDSDVDPATGQTIETIMMAAGATDLTWDAGLIAAASLGDFVWHDLNGNGVQDGGEPGIPGVTVELLENPDGDVSCSSGDEAVIAATVTDGMGLYGFAGLQPGDYCVQFGGLPGMAFSPKNASGDPATDSDADPATGRTDNIDLMQGEQDLTWDAGLVGDLPCILDIEKSCSAPQPPSGGQFLCEKPIDAFTMIWGGVGNIRIVAWKGDVGSEMLADIDNIMPDDEVTVSGYAGSPNDVIWEIFEAGTGNKLGESTFHLSCSDDDMDGPEDCGKFEGDGKGQSGFINEWILEGMVDAVGSFDCTPSPPGGSGQDQCELLGAGEVTYTYEITNIGPITIPIVTVEDDPDPGDPFPVSGSPIFGLAPGDTVTLQEVRFIDETTSNIATATGIVSPDPLITCTDVSNEVVVTVTACEVEGGGMVFDKNKVDWELSNPGALTTTVESIVIFWPQENKKLRKVKLEGKEIWTGDQPWDDMGFVVIPNKGTLAERQIAPGAAKTLRFEFEKDAVTSQDGYEIMVNFEEGCSVEFVPGSGPFTCTKPIDALTMIFDPEMGSPAFGTDVRIRAWKDTPGEELLADIDNIMSLDEVMVDGYAPKDGNDVIWEIFEAGTLNKLGQSTFHLSCSDDDMDGEEDCGKRQGDGKDQSGYLTDWLLEGMVDATGSFDCTP